MVNWTPTDGGKLLAVCYGCGETSRPLTRRLDGQPRISELENGWECVPGPTSRINPDGSCGSRFTCPECSTI